MLIWLLMAIFISNIMYLNTIFSQWQHRNPTSLHIFQDFISVSIFLTILENSKCCLAFLFFFNVTLIVDLQFYPPSTNVTMFALQDWFCESYKEFSQNVKPKSFKELLGNPSWLHTLENRNPIYTQCHN